MVNILFAVTLLNNGRVDVNLLIGFLMFFNHFELMYDAVCGIREIIISRIHNIYGVFDILIMR